MHQLLASIAAFFTAAVLNVYAYFIPPQQVQVETTSTPVVTLAATTTEEVQSTQEVKATTKQPTQKTTVTATVVPQPRENVPQIIIITTPPPQPEPVQAPQQVTYTEPATAAAPAPEFIEPRTMTPLEIATEIVKLYDQNGTAKMLNDTQVQVSAFGAQLTTDTNKDGWEESLKVNLRRVKH